MADAGMTDPLSMALMFSGDPQAYQNQLAVQRQRAMAQALLQGGADQSSAPGEMVSGHYVANPWSHLAGAAREALGAYMLKSADQRQADLYGSMMGGGQSAPTNSAGGPQLDTQGGTSGPATSAPIAPSAQQASFNPQQVAAAPQQQGGFASMLQIPNMTAQQSMMLYMSDRGAWATAYANAYGFTPDMKNALFAGGGDPRVAQQILFAKAQKDATVSGRPGGVNTNYLAGTTVGIPNQQGNVSVPLPNGQLGVMNAPGATSAIANSNFASTTGKNAATPGIGYDANSNPVPTNQAALTGNPNVFGLPGAGPMPGAQGQPQGQGAGLAPELKAGQPDFLKVLGTAAGSRANANVQAGAAAPDNINVLQNIIDLSKSGVQSGPVAEWKQHIAALYASIIPDGKAQDDVARFQELQKFTFQQGQRAWSAAGGTGTDAQLEAAEHANPNSAMFPQALQTIATWAKAGEMASLAKSNAQTAWFQQHGQSADQQSAFEAAWRNNLDRRIFQIQAMPQGSPEQAAFIKSLKPAEARALMQKRAALKAMGAL